MTEIDLFSWQPPKETAFGGETYEADQDYERLSLQLRKVFELMKDGRWRTIGEICEHCKYPQQSVSARLRDLRKEKYGAHTVERNRVSAGTYEYRVLVRAKVAA